MHLEMLNNFILVGGTALSLKNGHRKSIDLDLFSDTDFDNQQLKDKLTEIFTTFRFTSSNAAPEVFAYIDEVKVDFVKYRYHKRIRLMSSEDIAAMKIFALMQRAKKKGFYDLSLLLDIFETEK
ncbi:hypothetical protein A8C56_15305 [Niabella ginsenosidivorans]|uniref:Nucleotidyltransferase n=2 Tax=Niabella ginsenosidivorans TaxID=1176587 RepID=A0A1A9I4B3_9BACT|nr:hypothetical protein A8C56_15305 [Niabella ginsenosidivorans]